jgi:Protein of unknown function (DUF4236)
VGFGFRRSFRLGRGVRFNLSKSGAGVSVGRRGARLGATARGEKRASLSWKGLFWRKRL